MKRTYTPSILVYRSCVSLACNQALISAVARATAQKRLSDTELLVLFLIGRSKSGGNYPSTSTDLSKVTDGDYHSLFYQIAANDY